MYNSACSGTIHWFNNNDSNNIYNDNDKNNNKMIISECMILKGFNDNCYQTSVKSFKHTLVTVF